MKGSTFQTQLKCVQVEVDGSVSAYAMIWMNLKLEVQLGNAFYAISLATGTLIVPPSSLPEVVGVQEATAAEEGEHVVGVEFRI